MIDDCPDTKEDKLTTCCDDALPNLEPIDSSINVDCISAIDSQKSDVQIKEVAEIE